MMKRITGVLLVAVLLLNILMQTTVYAAGDRIQSGYWVYSVKDDGTAVIKAYKGASKKVTTPASLDGYAVTEIGSNAFRDDNTVVRMTISEGVTKIGTSAFVNCQKLTELSLPQSLFEMEQSCFERCWELESVVIPDQVKVIPDSAFYRCEALSSVTIGKQVEKIGYGAFMGCISLKSIYIPPCVTKVSPACGLGLFNGVEGIEMTGLVMMGESGSAAESYAQSYDIRFLAVEGDPPVLPTLPTEAPTEYEPGELYVRLNDSEPFRVNRGREYDLVFYTVNSYPIGYLWGGMEYDNKNFALVDDEICYSDEEDGALLTGSLDAYKTSKYVEFEIQSTSANEEDYAVFQQKNGLYYQPVLRIRIKPTGADGDYTIRYYLNENGAQDIYGRLLYDISRDFQNSHFFYGVMLLETDLDDPGLPTEPVDPTQPVLPTEPAVPAVHGSTRGDADGNGKVTVLDATRIQRYLALLISADEIDLIAADADLNGRVTVLDATRIQRVLAKICDMDGNPLNEEPQVPPADPVDPGVLSTPKITKVESGNSGVVITWDAVPGAEGYRVFMKNGSSWKGLGNTAATSFTHADAPYNTACIYTVRCVAADGVTFTSDYDSQGYLNTRLKAPVLNSAVLTDGFIGVSWDKVTGASAYRLYIKGGQYPSWTWIYDTEINYVDVDAGDLELNSNTQYAFTVRCVDEPLGDRLTSGCQTAGVSVRYYDTPYIYGIVAAGSGIELYWTEVEGVAQYRVFEWKNGGWKKLYDTADTALLISGLTPGASYRYTVRGMDKNGKYLTSYDCYGRMMNTRISSGPYSVKNIVNACADYAVGLGYSANAAAAAGSDPWYVYMLDCTGFYDGNTDHLEECITGRCEAMIDYYTKMLRRNAVDPSEFVCTVEVEGDDSGHIWFYLVLTPLPDAE